jgi:hypothetical protein
MNKLIPLGNCRYRTTARVFLDENFLEEREVEFAITYKVNKGNVIEKLIDEKALREFIDENIAIGATYIAVKIRRDGGVMPVPRIITIHSPKPDMIDIGVATPEQIESEKNKIPMPEGLRDILLAFNLISGRR